MTKKHNLAVELLAVIPAVLFIPSAIFGMVVLADHLETIWDDPFIKVIEYLLYWFLCIGAVLGAIGLLWGFISRRYNHKIVRIGTFRVLTFIGLIAASICVLAGIYFIKVGGLAAILLIAPIYVGINNVR